MMNLRMGRLVALSALAANLAVWSGPAHAQDSADARVRKLEAEVRALQRQVFPASGSQAAQPAAAAPQPGLPATTAVTDLLTRMDTLEAQNARLTAQVEELSNKVRQMSAGSPAPAAVAATPAPAEGVVAVAVPEAKPQPQPQPVETKLAPLPAPKPVAAAVAKPAATRLAAVKAIVKPQTADAGEDEYTYGFKLWEAKFYPEAAQQLKLFLDKYPKHKRVSYARNLLGRAYLDDGNPREAAAWFVQNYDGNKRGDRAADSLLYLSEAMIQLKDTNRACIALAEFSDSYKTEAAGRLKAQFDEFRSQVSCN